MQIRFKSPDPRAGMVVTMDSSRGQFFIDAGSAEHVRGTEAASKQEASLAPAPEPKAEAPRRSRKADAE